MEIAPALDVPLLQDVVDKWDTFSLDFSQQSKYQLHRSACHIDSPVTLVIFCDAST